MASLLGEDYLGWTQGLNQKNVKVEVIFDYMCPMSKAGLVGISTGDNETTTIYDLLEENTIDDETSKKISYLDAI